MSYNICFICCEPIKGYFEYSSPEESAAGTLCQLFQISLQYSTFTFGAKLHQATFCPQCVTTMKEIKRVLDDLRKLQKIIQEGRRDTAMILRNSCEKRKLATLKKGKREVFNESDFNSQRHPLDYFREEFVKVLEHEANNECLIQLQSGKEKFIRATPEKGITQNTSKLKDSLSKNTLPIPSTSALKKPKLEIQHSKVQELETEHSYSESESESEVTPIILECGPILPNNSQQTEEFEHSNTLIPSTEDVLSSELFPANSSLNDERNSDQMEDSEVEENPPEDQYESDYEDEDTNIADAVSDPDKNKTCLKCKRIFTRPYTLRLHIKTGCGPGKPIVKTPENPLVDTDFKIDNRTCLNCGITFARPFTLNRHIKSACCKKKTMKTILKTREQSPSAANVSLENDHQQYSSEHEEEEVDNETSYSTHNVPNIFDKEKVQKSREKLTHKCRDCNESFDTVRNLKFHSYKHVGGSPITCEVCSKPFAFKSDLDRHVWSTKHTMDEEESDEDI